MWVSKIRSNYPLRGCKTCAQAATVSVQNPTEFSRGSMSVGFIDEDERGPLHDGRAGAHERDLDIFDLTFTRTS
jgi:hypothetical protein